MYVLGISGSARDGSLNTALLRSLSEFFPKDIEFEVVDNLSVLPLYDQVSEDENVPAYLAELRYKVGRADAVILASPEHNYSFSASMKNALDLLSRPRGQSVLAGRLVALVGAAPGLYGTVRAQAQLRQVLHATGAKVLDRPEIYVNQADSKFGCDGTLLDRSARELCAQLVETVCNSDVFVRW
ncbi:MAG: NADPH-dependent FMN reductase [Ferrimicrobium sp.]|jgi:chromate reductase|uniref:NADPH-dependent FMN reductase n=1 Tax=Ferrimicrobium acidiphilum TaxID=121039 RepID=A0ABV3Y3T1_9ACTN|nr:MULTISPECIES: NAD(P)H-dependent oxidoreductase [Ferrimicrobium]